MRVRLLRAASACVLIALTGALMEVGTQSSPAGAASVPVCTFSHQLIGPIVDHVQPGTKVRISCTGFPANHPYLLAETSLTVAVDPAAQPLLTGSVTSLPGLLALISALPEINAGSLAFPTSDAKGNLRFVYTVPFTQPLAPHATCPPSTQEFNSGLIGCAVAMIDLTSFKPVTAGTFVIQYKGEPLLPPNPTLALTPTTAAPGQSVSVSDAPNATTYWWLSTLVAMSALLGSGSGGPPTFSVQVGTTVASSSVSVTPASYHSLLLLDAFTPPKLSGSFTVPSGTHGHQKVQVTMSTQLLGFQFQSVAIAPLTVT